MANNTQLAGDEALRSEVLRLSMIIDGDEKYDIVGLRERVEKMEEIAQSWQRTKWVAYGILAGLGLNGVGVGAILIKLLGAP